MINSAEYWIKKLDLTKHPEGGWFKEVYRSEESIPKNALPLRFNGDRSFSTSIYFLLEGKEFSAFHRIKSDETWHFYTGTSLTIFMIDQKGILSQTLLGNNPENKEIFQFTVPKEYWFAAKVNDENSFALVGCTVSPGFDFADFELGKRNDLWKEYPQHGELIKKMTY